MSLLNTHFWVVAGRVAQYMGEEVVTIVFTYTYRDTQTDTYTTPIRVSKYDTNIYSS